MTSAQRFIVALLVFGVLLLMAIPAVAFVLLGELALLSLWSFCCLVIIGMIAWRSIPAMKPGKMMIRSCFGNVYPPLYTPEAKKNAQGIKDGLVSDGEFGSGLINAFPPKMVVVYTFPTGIVELPMLSNSANVMDNPTDIIGPHPTERKDMTPVRIYLHVQAQIAQEPEQVEKLIHLLLGVTDHIDFTHMEKINYFFGRDDDNQTPEQQLRDCPCLVKYLVGLFQSAVDEAVSFVLTQYTLKEARSSIHSIEDKILERLQEPNTIFKKNELDKVFIPLDFNILGVVPDQKVRDALSSSMAAKLEARGTVETARGERDALSLKREVLESEGGKVGLAGEVAMQIAKNAGTIITSNAMDTSESMIVANRATQPKSKPPAPTT